MRAITLMVCSLMLFGTASAQKGTDADLPIHGFGTAKDVPGAKETPNPALTYKVLFKISKAAEKPDDVNPDLDAIAKLVNTFTQYGIPPSHRKFAIIVYHDATDIVLNDDEYKARHKHHANPNTAVMQALAKAGVEIKVCGQSVIWKKIDPKTIQPEVELDLAEWITVMNLEAQGYVLVGN